MVAIDTEGLLLCWWGSGSLLGGVVRIYGVADGNRKGNLNTMRVSIDAAGRLVIPQALRELMQMEAGSPVDIRFHNDHLELTVPSASVRLVDDGSGPVAVPDEEMPKLTARQVRETLARERC